ncbi:MAG TPA: tripartite tricarboxylate transporter substrate binding protein [Burkholderiales bacterium]
MMNRALAALLLALPMAVAAQTFPTKTVRIVSPYPPGAGPDTVARLLAEKLSKGWGQQVIVEPRPGANGFLAMEAVKKSTDAHDVVLADNGHIAVAPSLFKRLPYDVEKDFQPAALIYRADFLIAVATSAPYKSVGELIAAAKASPGRISYATPFVGSPSHLGSALLEMRTGTQMLHVPFKETSQMVAAVGNGDVTWTLTTLATAGSLVRAGKVRFLAVAAKSRLPAQPEIPTVPESGGPADYEVNGWVAFLSPAAAPREAVEAINAAVSKALAEPDLRERLTTFGFTPLQASRAALADLIRADTAKFGELVRKTGATID